MRNSPGRYVKLLLLYDFLHCWLFQRKTPLPTHFLSYLRSYTCTTSNWIIHLLLGLFINLSFSLFFLHKYLLLRVSRIRCHNVLRTVLSNSSPFLKIFLTDECNYPYQSVNGIIIISSSPRCFLQYFKTK